MRTIKKTSKLVTESKSSVRSIRMRPSLEDLVHREARSEQRPFADMVHRLLYEALENRGVLDK